MEDGLSWIQGTYTIQPDTIPTQLDLHIEDGSDGKNVSKTICYHYNLDADLLTITPTEQPTALNVQSPSERYVFIGYNMDSSDDDDDDDGEVTFYASCFVGELTRNDFLKMNVEHRTSNVELRMKKINEKNPLNKTNRILP